MTLRVWNSTLARRTPLRNGKPLKRTVKIRKSNPARQARHDAEYRRKLAAYRASPAYRFVARRAEGQCEFLLPDGLLRPGAVRCPVTDGLQHHHRTYVRLGGGERPEDIQVLCQFHHALAESAHPTRRHGRVR